MTKTRKWICGLAARHLIDPVTNHRPPRSCTTLILLWVKRLRRRTLSPQTRRPDAARERASRRHSTAFAPDLYPKTRWTDWCNPCEKLRATNPARVVCRLTADLDRREKWTFKTAPSAVQKAFATKRRSADDTSVKNLKDFDGTATNRHVRNALSRTPITISGAAARRHNSSNAASGRSCHCDRKPVLDSPRTDIAIDRKTSIAAPTMRLNQPGRYFAR